MSSSFIHSQLNDQTSWEDLKRIFGLRKPTIEKLQANDPHTPEGLLVWAEAGVINHDAMQLWDNLTPKETTEEKGEETGEETSDDNSRSATSKRADRSVADGSPQK